MVLKRAFSISAPSPFSTLRAQTEMLVLGQLYPDYRARASHTRGTALSAPARNEPTL